MNPALTAKRSMRPSPPARVVPAVAAKWRQLLPALIVIYACILPRELTITIAAVDFRPYRIALLLVAPMAVQMLVKSSKRPSVFDGLAVFVGFWYVIALLVNETLDTALATGLGQAADFLLAYLVGRSCIQQPRDVGALFVAILPGFLIEGVILGLESVIFHRNIFRPTLAGLLGVHSQINGLEERWGMARALGTFPHPIISGTFVATAFPFAVLVTQTMRHRIMGIIASACCIFTVSSTSMLNLIVSFVMVSLLVGQRMTRWPLLWIAAAYSALFLIAVTLLSEGGLMSFIIRYASINSATGYYRRFIWYYAGAEANAHPWFGIGLRDWTRPAWMLGDTIDASWLLMTMRYGYPAGMVFLILAIGNALRLALKAKRLSLYGDRNAYAAVSISIFSLLVSGMSVYIWEGLWVWMVVLIGAATSLAGYQATDAARMREVAQASRRGVRKNPRFTA